MEEEQDGTKDAALAELCMLLNAGCLTSYFSAGGYVQTMYKGFLRRTFLSKQTPLGFSQ